jgi:hypothetical protein
MWTVALSCASGLLVAQIGRLLDWHLCWPVGALLGVVALGVWIFVWLKRWRQQSGRDAPASPQTLLDQYEQLAAEGLLDPDELARIKASLQAKPDTAPPSNPPMDSVPPHE